MPAPSPYIPTKQNDLDTWSQNFSTKITANPPLYGLVAADATVIAAFTATFHTALGVVNTPATKTAVTVANKDAASAAMLDILRGYAIMIRNNAGVANSDKAALGLTIPTLTPTPIVAPTTNPILGLLGATPLQLTLKSSDSATPTTKAKPFGAISLEVHAAASATVITDPASLPYVGDFTKSPFAIDFLSGDVGKQAYIAARWKTRRGLVGPWSSIVHMTVVG
jgi:hypothetical protein